MIPPCLWDNHLDFYESIKMNYPLRPFEVLSSVWEWLMISYNFAWAVHILILDFPLGVMESEVIVVKYVRSCMMRLEKIFRHLWFIFKCTENSKEELKIAVHIYISLVLWPTSIDALMWVLCAFLCLGAYSAWFTRVPELLNTFWSYLRQLYDGFQDWNRLLCSNCWESPANTTNLKS